MFWLSLTLRNEEKGFNAKYETLTPNVVPRSAQKLAQDDEFGLYSVTLFRRDIAEFSHRCRELKFVPSRHKLTEGGSHEISSTVTRNSAEKRRNTIKHLKSKRNYGYPSHP
jgi:V-type H+-transporting ATPase subunit C